MVGSLPTNVRSFARESSQGLESDAECIEHITHFRVPRWIDSKNAESLNE